MKETWRWFGDFDPITLDEIAQTGAQGIVTALHEIPYGEVWPRERIAACRDRLARAGFSWDVVESLPVHDALKVGEGAHDALYANYRQSLANLAAEGVRTVCYNFMPLLDWTRTDLRAPVARGGSCLRFSAPRMAAFEIHMLGMEEARARYAPEAVAAADAWIAAAGQAERDALLEAIMAGLPGAFPRYDIAGLKAVLADRAGLTRDDLRANFKRFIREVAPAAAELGVRLAIHPDDPPRDILGLPRIVSSAEDIAWILGAEDSPSNGLTLCSGSLGASARNDVPAIARAFADRIHFAHLRNVRRFADGSFEEAAHLDGDVDLPATAAALLEAERARGEEIPFRPDHGHELLDDASRGGQPGYSLIGRMRGLAELCGLLAGLEWARGAA
ncbi:mannonate dehydratase [Oceanicella actignis]|uniref:Mannonate dehydratase n=1 Tax=Oceanicella actignis TaxID=1189325 RepID=A0A1M7RZS0_9RHOB|nr:mannonate dehydratase [Oceanicella actignis]SES94604.1 D-mannonate dehydratase [Oceanicella actignis]SHN51670.1 mannonate dehydratase [Oceanicella actignis]